MTTTSGRRGVSTLKTAVTYIAFSITLLATTDLWRFASDLSQHESVGMSAHGHMMNYLQLVNFRWTTTTMCLQSESKTHDNLYIIKTFGHM